MRLVELWNRADKLHYNTMAMSHGKKGGTSIAAEGGIRGKI